MTVWLIPMLYTVASARDSSGTIRVGFPVPTWQDYLALSLDEIRQFGARLSKSPAAASGVGRPRRLRGRNEPARSGAAVSRSFEPQRRALGI